MRQLLRMAVAAIALCAAAMVAEAAFRVLDGFQIEATRLRPRAIPPVSTNAPSPQTLQYVRELPVADGVRREWFEQSPPPLARSPLPADLAEAIRTPALSAEVLKQWNTRYIQERACVGDPFFQQFPGFAFSFEPADRSPHPPYRYLANVTTPFGLVTNRFGLRGHEISADKPARTVRVAFVGASTTVGSHSQPFSYPEFIEAWLNLWAREHAPGVRFEIVNGGREGILSVDIAAIARQELAPLEPDVIVYHEGANQFTFQEIVEENGEPFVVPADLGSATLLPGRTRSALVRRLDIALRRFVPGAGAEPRKPKYRLHWPDSVDETHPDPDSPQLPAHLPQVVRDLDDIRRTASAIGAKVVMTSFVWMVKDGLVVDAVDRGEFFKMLNLRHWPARYADIRRLADFQNRVFRGYASSRGLPFIDISTPYPMDIELFTDAIHMTLDGDRLRAWIVFQGLVPILVAEVEAGRLPRPDRARYQLVPGPSAIPRASLECTDFQGYPAVPGAFPLGALRPSDGASVGGDHPRRLVTPPGRNAYAAEIPIAEALRQPGAGIVRWRVHVRSGRIALAVMKADRSSFLTYRTLDAGSAPVDLYLQTDSLSNAGFLMITNAVRADGERSVVDVEDVALLRRTVQSTTQLLK